MQETLRGISQVGFDNYSKGSKQGEGNFAAASQSLLEGTGRFILPLYSHKRESDRLNKHLKWTTQKHIVLTTLAILTDLGFDSAVLISFFSGNRWESAGIKALYNVGAGIIPQYITDFKNKMIHEQS